MPEYAALFLVAAVAGVLPGQVAGRAVTIIAISGLIGIVLVKYRDQYREWWPSIRPLFWPFFVLMVFVGISGLRAVLFQKTLHTSVIDDAKPFLYWLLFPIIALSLNTPKKLKHFIVAVVVLAVYIAIGQIIQGLFGVHVFFGGVLGEAETLGRYYSGATRSMTPGIYVLLFGLLVTFALYLVKARHILLLPLMLLFSLGLTLTYGRTLMGVTVLVLLFMGFMMGGTRIVRLLVAGMLVLLIAIPALAVIKPNTLYALKDRVMSVDAEIRGGGSLGYRIVENSVAWKRIKNAPLLGIGLGHVYRLPSLMAVEHQDVDFQTRYMHNGYLYVQLKLGIFAFLAYFWFIASALSFSRNTFKRLALPHDKAVAAAITALFVMPIFTSLTRPEWMSESSTAVYAICLAILTAYWRHKVKDVSSDTKTVS